MKVPLKVFDYMRTSNLYLPQTKYSYVFWKKNCPCKHILSYSWVRLFLSSNVGSYRIYGNSKLFWSAKTYLKNFSRFARLLLINICIHFSRKQCMIHWSGKSGIHISIFSDFKGILIFLLIPLAHCFFFLPTCQVFVVLLVWEYHWYQGTYNEHIYLYTLAFITALYTII